VQVAHSRALWLDEIQGSSPSIQMPLAGSRPIEHSYWAGECPSQQPRHPVGIDGPADINFACMNSPPLYLFYSRYIPVHIKLTMNF
jgi:hypothetical protein